jgi:hypothetical protein
VSSVLPGPTETESLKSFISSVNPGLSYADAERKFMAENRRSSLIYRLAKPHEVANVVASWSANGPPLARLIRGLVPEIGEYAPISGMKSAHNFPEAIKTYAS